MSLSHRSLVQSLNSRQSSQEQKLPSQALHRQLDKLEVVIPQSLSQQFSSSKKESRLRPLQTGTRKTKLLPLAEVKQNHPKDPVQFEHPKDPVKIHSPIVVSKKPEYKLVEDKDVPLIIKDFKHKKRYKKLECLGNGAFARVYRVASDQGKFHAAKIVAKSSLTDKRLKSKLLAEINIHRSLKHDYIVTFLECFEDRHNIYLILELCQNRTLSVMLRNRHGSLTELEVRYYMGQILSALRYMSDNRILHRDLKLSNILLDANMDCKLGDFGLAALLVNSEDRKRTVCGTLHYIAPEILFNKDGHNHRADMWSAGVLMFILLFGKQPFPHVETKELYRVVRKNEHRPQFFFPEDEFIVSNHAKSLICDLLVNDPDKRLSVIEALQHPFFLDDIPDCIPQSALYKAPDYRDLFVNQYSPASFDNTQQSASKVAMAVQQARDINHCFIDRDIRPPLEILEETIYDHRSQYPVPYDPTSLSQQYASQPLVVPVEISLSTNAKKRAAAVECFNTVDDADTKRICNDLEVKKQQAEQQKTQHEQSTKSNVSGSRNASHNSSNSSSGNSKQFAVPTALPNRRPVMEEMADNLKIMFERSSAFPKERRFDEVPEDQDFEWTNGNVFIETWVDCSKHYGFAYCLSDGTIGMLYNDGSTITSYGRNHYYYIYHRIEDNRYVEQEYAEIPPLLKKKCAILNQFRDYEGPELAHETSHPKTTKLTRIHLFKYNVSDQAIAFRLNNGVVQLNFFKHTKLILYEKARKLIFVDRSGKLRRHHTLDVLRSKDTEIADSLLYAFTVLEEQNAYRLEALRLQRWKRYQKKEDPCTKKPQETTMG